MFCLCPALLLVSEILMGILISWTNGAGDEWNTNGFLVVTSTEKGVTCGVTGLRVEDGSWRWSGPGVGDLDPGPGVENTNNGCRVTGGRGVTGAGLWEKKT